MVGSVLDPREKITVTLDVSEWAVIGSALVLVERISFDDEPSAILAKIRDAIAIG